MLVKVRVIGNAWGHLGIMWPKGKTEYVDEKQAELGVQLKVFEIIEVPQKKSTGAKPTSFR